LFCSSLLFPNGKEEARREKKKTGGERGMAFPHADQLMCWLQPVPGLPQLSCAIKSWYKGGSLNFMHTLCVGSNLIG
jgi:hypothetical protein